MWWGVRLFGFPAGWGVCCVVGGTNDAAFACRGIKITPAHVSGGYFYL